MLNNCTFVGRFVANPELKATNSGESVCTFRLAVSDDFNKDKSNFFTFVAWDGAAETISKFFLKGQRIIVSSRASTRKWVDKNNNIRETIEFIVEKFWFVEKNNNPSASETNTQGNSFQPVDDDNDLPF